MKDDQLLRYSRQIVLPEIEIEGQKKIISAKVLVIGIGALGSVVANYLCRVGVGTLGIVDFDKIELSNSHRQIFSKTPDIGKPKVKQAIKELSSINPECNLIGIEKKIDLKLLEKLIVDFDLVVDATDNFKTRYEINKACFLKKKYLVSGSVIEWSGQVIVFNFLKPNYPCYECCFGYFNEEDLSCSEVGVIAPIAGIIGSFQALEAIKRIVGLKSSNEMILKEFNFLSGEIKRVKIKKDLACRICSGI